jgi:O-antigen ligase
MFAIPGILGILLFIYLRPQEAFAPLQGVPFLYLFFALILFGAAVDLRLRVTKAIPIPALPWAVAFLIWCLITVAIMKPDQLMPSAIQLFITIAIFVLVAQSIQSFQVFEKVAAMLIVLGMLLTLIAIHQSRAPLTCVIAPAGEGNHNETGTPTGIPCVKARSCYIDAKDPSVDYYCERVGVLGTHSIGKRVRYRGVLQDPNELAIALTSGLALLIALWLRTRKRRWKWVALTGVFLVAWAVKETGSRSGQLGLLATLGAFLFWRYRWKLAVVAAPMMVPLLLLVAKGGSDRADAASSSTERYEAWLAGMEMFRQSPIWGIGFGQFNDHHFLTAHNTLILVFAELGIVGTFIFSMLVWIMIKTPILILKRYSGHEEARVSVIWSIALLASIGAILAGSAFLSFAYHYILWIFMGLAGGLFISVRRHDPEFEVRISFIDAGVVLLFDIVMFFLLTVFLRLKGIS